MKVKLTTDLVLAFPDYEEPLIVETNTSSLAVGAVLMQEEEGDKCHPVQFASHTMNNSKRNYSVCERKALAVVFALKKFRVYLLSRFPLQLITNHQALQYTFNMKNVHGRLAQ